MNLLSMTSLGTNPGYHEKISLYHALHSFAPSTRILPLLQRGPEKLPSPPLLLPALGRFRIKTVEESPQCHEITPSEASARLLHLPTPTGRRTLKSGKGQPLLYFVSGEFQDNQLLCGEQSINLLLLLSTLLSSYKVPQILLTWSVWAALTCPFKAHAEQNLLPLLGLKPGLRSHKWTRSHVLNPGLPLESPGALPAHHTDAPTGPRENPRTLR